MSSSSLSLDIAWKCNQRTPAEIMNRRVVHNQHCTLYRQTSPISNQWEEGRFCFSPILSNSSSASPTEKIHSKSILHLLKAPIPDTPFYASEERLKSKLNPLKNGHLTLHAKHVILQEIAPYSLSLHPVPRDVSRKSQKKAYEFHHYSHHLLGLWQLFYVHDVSFFFFHDRSVSMLYMVMLKIVGLTRL